MQIELYYGRGCNFSEWLKQRPSLCRGPFKLMKKTAEMTENLKAIILMLRLSYPYQIKTVLPNKVTRNRFVLSF